MNQSVQMGKRINDTTGSVSIAHTQVTMSWTIPSTSFQCKNLVHTCLTAGTEHISSTFLGEFKFVLRGRESEGAVSVSVRDTD